MSSITKILSEYKGDVLNFAMQFVIAFVMVCLVFKSCNFFLRVMAPYYNKHLLDLKIKINMRYHDLIEKEGKKCFEKLESIYNLSVSKCIVPLRETRRSKSQRPYAGLGYKFFPYLNVDHGFARDLESWYRERPI